MHNYYSLLGNVKQISWSLDGSCLASVSDRVNDVRVRIVKGVTAVDFSHIKGTVRIGIGIVCPTLR